MKQSTLALIAGAFALSAAAFVVTAKPADRKADVIKEPTAAPAKAEKDHPVSPLDFKLKSIDGKEFDLSQFKGKTVVLAWYPKAYTSGCTIECKSLATKGDLIRAYDVTYFMASVDPVDQNKGFAAQQNADFPLLSDPSKKTAESYGVLAALGYAKRWTFYIGKDGKILAIDQSVKPESSAEDMAAKLGELKVPHK